MSVTTSSDRAALGRAFGAARAQGRAALVPYVTAGHPSPDDTPAILRMLADEGADVIELGVPFSDPLADGPVIQRSSFRAIEQGVDLEWALQALAAFRHERDTPVVVFTYLNPVLHHGLDRFLDDAAAAGANAVLLTDLPVGADAEIEARFEAAGMDLIRLVSPTTTPDRVKIIARAARGFLYYVSRTGVTGVAQSLSAGLAGEVAEVRAVTDVPVAVGFGVSTAAQAAEVAAIADGVVVGSALVDRLERGGIEAARELMRELRGAVESVARS